MRYEKFKQGRDHFFGLLVAIVVLVVSSGLLAQEKSSAELSDFGIQVETTENEVKLKCTEGCAWKELTYTISQTNSAQAVDEYGMTAVDNASSAKDSDLADFLFAIQKADNGLKVTGVEGTAWKDLAFSCLFNCDQALTSLVWPISPEMS